MSTFGKRRERLLSLASGFDTVIVTSPKNLFYLTDFWGGGVGLVGRDATTIFTSVMEEGRAREVSKGAEVKASAGMAEMYAAVKRYSKGKVLTDQYDPRIKGTIDEGIFLDARRKKDEEELRRISSGSRRLDDIYRTLEKEIRPGRTELQVAAEVMRSATREGFSPLAAEGSLSPIIIASGPNGALPHAELTERKLRKGDMVVADIFFRYQGYCTDCTRTYAVGRVGKKEKESYEAVLEAQLAGVKLIKKGASAKKIHARVKDVLREHGLEQYFTHGTGHGVGIDIHERPSIGGKSEDVLAECDVVTVEPGVYIPEKYGIRIEDTVSLEAGTNVLYDYTKELLVL